MAPDHHGATATRCSPATVRRCHHCGTRIPTGDWYPVVATTDDSGAIDLLAFCERQCRDDWLG